MSTINVPHIHNSAVEEGKSYIGTHNGTFHCDEALACALLGMTKEFSGMEIVRTRDPAQLAKCKVVVDVGGVYDPATHRYDHHQNGFTETMDDYSIKLSSAGLVYKHFGKEVIANLWPNISNAHSVTLYDKMYKNFVMHIDGIDNGIPSADGQENYKVTTSLSSRVGRLNPGWNSNDNPNEGFKRAVKLTGEEFCECLRGYIEDWLPARSIVEAAMARRFEVHPSGKVIVLERSCPWKEHLYMLEEEGDEVLFCLYGDSNGKWRVQTVSVSEGSFTSRLSLPEPWRGIRDQELSTITGIGGCIFVHASGFIGGNDTYQGALEMASKALEMSCNQPNKKQKA